MPRCRDAQHTFRSFMKAPCRDCVSDVMEGHALLKTDVHAFICCSQGAKYVCVCLSSTHKSRGTHSIIEPLVMNALLVGWQHVASRDGVPCKQGWVSVGVLAAAEQVSLVQQSPSGDIMSMSGVLRHHTSPLMRV